MCVNGMQYRKEKEQQKWQHQCQRQSQHQSLGNILKRKH